MRSFLFVPILCLLLLGCKKTTNQSSAHNHNQESGEHSHSHEEGGDHAHEEKTAQITVWSTGYEIFTEHTAAVAGTPTRFITHVSDLNTGHPRKDGMVKFALAKGAESFEHPQARPERAGIYIPAITFPAPGDWTMKVMIPGPTNTFVDIGTIKVFASVDAAAHAEFTDVPEGVSFLKEQQWRIAAKTYPAYRGSITNYLAAPATVVAAPGMSASIHPAVAGQIMKQEVALGSEVQAGQVLGWLQPAFNEGAARLVEAQAETTRAQAQAAQARQAFERVKRLHAQRAKSDRELQEAEAALLSAEASYQAAQGVTSLFQTSNTKTNGGATQVAMRSPVAGVLEAVYRNPGERGQPDDPVYTVINSSSVQIEARLTPSQLASAATGLNALFLPSGKLNNQPVIYPVEKVAVSQVLDPVTRLGEAVYQLPKNPGLAIGSFGNIRIAAQVTTNTIVIPTSAIVDDEGLPVAFVQVSGETFQKRDLTLGIQDHAWTEVMSGIAEGERVVVDGAYPLLLSTKSGTIPAHGHAH